MKSKRGNRSKYILIEDSMCDKECNKCDLYEKVNENNGICHMMDCLQEQELYESLIREMR